MENPSCVKLITLPFFSYSFPCSKKFWRKVCFIPTLQHLSGHVQLDEQYISAPVAEMDRVLMSRLPASQKYKAGQQVPRQKDSPSTTRGQEVAEQQAPSDPATVKQDIDTDQLTADDKHGTKEETVTAEGVKNEE